MWFLTLQVGGRGWFSGSSLPGLRWVAGGQSPVCGPLGLLHSQTRLSARVCVWQGQAGRGVQAPQLQGTGHWSPGWGPEPARGPPTGSWRPAEPPCPPYPVSPPPHAPRTARDPGPTRLSRLGRTTGVRQAQKQ